MSILPGPFLVVHIPFVVTLISANDDLAQNDNLVEGTACDYIVG
jgi:hypothetical protein